MNTLIKTMRPPFLLLTPVCVFLGFATAFVSTSQIALLDCVLVLLGALSAHISVNMLNEYVDFKTGLDAKTTKTPFSGGSGALVEDPARAKQVLYTGIVCLFLTILIGIYFIASLGMQIIPLGLLGVVIVMTYTPWLNRFPILCLLAPGIGFGPLMVIGTHVILAGEYSLLPAIASLVPMFLVSNLLLLNQYPDIDADKSVGRRTFPVIYGVKASSLVYGMFVLLSCASVISGIVVDVLPKLATMSLIAIVVGFVVCMNAARYAQSLNTLLPYLGLNVLITLLAPVLLAIAIIFRL